MTTQERTTAVTVRALNDALNARDREAAVALCSASVSPAADKIFCTMPLLPDTALTGRCTAVTAGTCHTRYTAPASATTGSL